MFTSHSIINLLVIALAFLAISIGAQDVSSPTIASRIAPTAVPSLPPAADLPPATTTTTTTTVLASLPQPTGTFAAAPHTGTASRTGLGTGLGRSSLTQILVVSTNIPQNSPVATPILQPVATSRSSATVSPLPPSFNDASLSTTISPLTWLIPAAIAALGY